MQKILLTLTQAVTVKNVLRTGIAKELTADATTQLVFVARNDERIAYYRNVFSAPNASYTSHYTIAKSLLEAFFSHLKIYTLKTRSTDLRRRALAHDTGSWIRYWIGMTLNRALAHSSVRTCIRFLDYHLIRCKETEQFLRSQQPNIVVLTNLFDDAEITLMREARRLGIKTVGFINSWDRLTARWTIRLLPDQLIVYNELVMQDAIKHADMPPEKIVVAGIPQYDRYITETPISRDAFLQENGFGPKEKFILVAPMGAAFSDSDWLLIDLLHDILDIKHEVENLRMLVRFQPNDFLDEKEIATRPWLIYDLPGVRFGTIRDGDWDMTEKDLASLHASLAHASALVSYASSIAVDAAIMDTPILHINFPLSPITRLLKAPTYFYATEHYGAALATGAMRLVHDRAELVASLKEYITHPELQQKERHTLAKQQCVTLDGKAAQRIASTIITQALQEAQ